MQNCGMMRSVMCPSLNLPPRMRSRTRRLASPRQQHHNSQTFSSTLKISIWKLKVLSDTNKSLKSKFQKYWEKFWLNTIGVERLSVYKAPLRTNNCCESYHARLAKTIGIRPNFWVFIRQINRLLEINDINMERLVAETPISRRPKKPNENEIRIQKLV